MIGLALLRVLKYRKSHDKVVHYVKRTSVDKTTYTIIKAMTKYFEEDKEAESLDIAAFRFIFHSSVGKNLSEDDKLIYDKIISRLKTDVSEAVSKNMINNLVELNCATKVSQLIQDYNEENEIDIIQEIEEAVSHAKGVLERSQSFDFALFDEVIQESDNREEGALDWHLDCLRETYYRPCAGEQSIIAARAGMGKTTFMTHMNVSLAKASKPNQKIIWFNNESSKEKILQRQIQSALNKSRSDLLSMERSVMKEEYAKVMGSADKLLVIDIHGKSITDLEEILESVGVGNVAAIIIDMLDSVALPNSKDMREDLRLEKLYQWSRNMAIKYGAVSFPTSQLSGAAQGMQFPSMDMLAGSKTAKAGACDNIIMLGHTDDPMQAKSRWISMPKTKTKREGKFDMRAELILDADNGRYLETTGG